MGKQKFGKPKRLYRRRAHRQLCWCPEMKVRPSLPPPLRIALLKRPWFPRYPAWRCKLEYPRVPLTRCCSKRHASRIESSRHFKPAVASRTGGTLAGCAATNFLSTVCPAERRGPLSVAFKPRRSPAFCLRIQRVSLADCGGRSGLVWPFDTQRTGPCAAASQSKNTYPRDAERLFRKTVARRQCVSSNLLGHLDD